MRHDLLAERLRVTQLVKYHNGIRKEKNKIYTFTCDVTYMYLLNNCE